MPPVLQCTRLRARLLQGDSNADDGDDGDYDDGDDGDDGDYDDGDVYEYLTNYTCNADDSDDGDYDDGDEDGDDLFSLAAGKRALHNRNVHRNVQPYPQRRLRVLS